MSESVPPGDTDPSIFGVKHPGRDFHFLRDLVHSRRSGGRRAGGVMRDYLAMCLRQRRLMSPDHYFKFRLYEIADRERHRLHDFIDDAERRKLNTIINRHGYGHVIDNKLYLESVLRDHGVPGAETLAVLLDRPVPFDLAVFDEGALRTRFLEVGFPLFCKPVAGSLSSGAVLIERFDAESDRLTLAGGLEVTLSEFFGQARERYGKLGYLVQRKLDPHAAMRAVSGGAIGSVRVVTLTDGERTVPLYAGWKIPSINAIADAPWRTGFTVADLDMDDGKVLSCQIGSGTASRAIEKHPETGAAIVGTTLPCWGDVRRIAVEAAALFYSTSVIGWDIAITDEGPRIIEGNTNPDHGLLQTASGRGLYETEAGRKLLEARRASERKSEDIAKKNRLKRRELIRERRERALREGLDRKAIRDRDTDDDRPEV